MNIRYFNSLFLILIVCLITACLSVTHSEIYINKLKENKQENAIGEVKFLYGDLAGIYPQTLKTNSFVFKITLLSLHLNQGEDSLKNTALDQQKLFHKYGFLFPSKIWHPLGSRDVRFEKPAGIISGKVSGFHPIKGKFNIETAAFGCGACHSNIRFDQNGNPTNELVPGLPNTSLDLNAFAHDLYNGYKIIANLSETEFENKILKIFPEVNKEEMLGLRLYLIALKIEIQKLEKTINRPTPYDLGGPGITNGVGSIKRVLGLIDNYKYHTNENALVAIPELTGISLRSSLLVSGNYAPKGREFFKEISIADTAETHLKDLAKIVSIFTIGTIGYDEKLAFKSIPDIEEIVKYLAKLETPSFPGKLNWDKADKGRKIYRNNCESCHGEYIKDSTKNKLVSFPNKLISLNTIKTDSLRALGISSKDLKYLHKTRLSKYIDASANKGYVAPILNNLWATAPYLHNGSVPTLWHLMHPELRPDKFYVGGHKLDYSKVGIMGELYDNVYKYPDDYSAWSNFEIYNTSLPGRSNKGHEEQFNVLTESQKEDLIEFLKTL